MSGCAVVLAGVFVAASKTWMLVAWFLWWDLASLELFEIRKRETWVIPLLLGDWLVVAFWEAYRPHAMERPWATSVGWKSPD